MRWLARLLGARVQVYLLEKVRIVRHAAGERGYHVFYQLLAGARGATHLISDASDNAVPFFEKRGYVAQSRNTVITGDEWLANTTMRKALAANGNTP